MQNKSLLKNAWRGFQQRAQSLFKNPYRQVNVNWFTLKYYKHLPAGKTRKHRLFGKYIYFSSATEFLHGLKEIFLEKIYSQSLPPEPFIVDCGANIGMSIIYMKEQYPAATILAFEPDQHNFELLSANMQSFGYGGVTLRPEAVWIENTTLQFSGDASMSSKISEPGAAGTVSVKAVRLKDFLDRPVDFLKIDIEGAEFAVLGDIADKLHLVRHLFLEYHGTYEQHEELTQLFSLISQSGFHYYIREAAPVYPHPFKKEKQPGIPYDVQLNIFCSRD